MQSSKRAFCSRSSVLSDSAETAVIAFSVAGRGGHRPADRALLLSGTGLPRSFGRNLQDTQKHLCTPACFWGFLISAEKAVPSFGSDSVPLPSKAGFITLHLCTLSLRPVSSLGRRPALLSTLNTTYAGPQRHLYLRQKRFYAALLSWLFLGS